MFPRRIKSAYFWFGPHKANFKISGPQLYGSFQSQLGDNTAMNAFSLWDKLAKKTFLDFLYLSSTQVLSQASRHCRSLENFFWISCVESLGLQAKEIFLNEQSTIKLYLSYLFKVQEVWLNSLYRILVRLPPRLIATESLMLSQWLIFPWIWETYLLDRNQKISSKDLMQCSSTWGEHYILQCIYRRVFAHHSEIQLLFLLSFNQQYRTKSNFKIYTSNSAQRTITSIYNITGRHALKCIINSFRDIFQVLTICISPSKNDLFLWKL